MQIDPVELCVASDMVIVTMAVDDQQRQAGQFPDSTHEIVPSTACVKTQRPAVTDHQVCTAACPILKKKDSIHDLNFPEQLMNLLKTIPCR
jgi:hypothetical protein